MTKELQEGQALLEDTDEESKFKKRINDIFEKALQEGTKRFGENLMDHLGEVLRNSEDAVVKHAVPRAVRKHASQRTAEVLLSLLREKPDVAGELRDIGVSIANTLRPLAGNRFTNLVKSQIEKPLMAEGIGCETKGKIKQKLNKILGAANKDLVATEGGEFKPDIDIVCYDIATRTPFLIISCKTSLAERIMQTVSWNNHLELLTRQNINVKIFLVTAWDTFEESTQRARAYALEGAYAANTEVREDEKIKRLSKIVPDIVKLRDESIGKPKQEKLA